MLVAVFRARHDGERTAERLRGRGHGVLLAPVLDVVPTGEPVPTGPFEGVIFTSAHGVEALSESAVAPLVALPCFCVGDRTASCARAVGFADLRSGQADAERLAALVRATVADAACLLLVAGRDRKPAIEARLAAAGYMVRVAELYEARAIGRWDTTVETEFAEGGVGAALHYSRRSAALAVRCAQAGSILNDLRRARHHCLSEDAASPLRELGAAEIVVAAEPNETSLLGSLEGYD